MSPFSSILRCFETCPHFHTLKKEQSQNYTPTDRVRKNAEISCISLQFFNSPDMFPFTRKPGCFECFLNDVYSVKPRKIAVLSIVPCQQNHALNVPCPWEQISTANFIHRKTLIAKPFGITSGSSGITGYHNNFSGS